MNPLLTFLSLGDSYTIGEGCAIHESFPYQAVAMLRKEGRACSAPEIIARTGWTTSDLLYQVRQTVLLPRYDIVTLLIGVNNQYRGESSSQYALQFEELLIAATALGEHVFVLSIPDWSLTPFGAERGTRTVTAGISVFNSINSKISRMHKTHYIDITTGSPETTDDPLYIGGDGLHPSGKAYVRWAKLLTHNILSTLK